MLSLQASRHLSRLSRPSATSWRAMSASATAGVEEQPQTVGTSGRYAAALYALGSKTNSLKTIADEVVAMQKMQASSQEFNEFLLNPTLQRTAKVETLSEVTRKAGFSKTFSHFMTVVAENGRTPETGKILAAFTDMISATEGKAVVKVTTALPLTEWELALLKKNIRKRYFQENSEINLETAIDKSLLGGLTIQIGDKFMDLSTRTELRKLSELIASSH